MEADCKYTIVTGRYDTAPDEQKEAVSAILGAEKVGEKYRLYFHWYNVIHELGHLILRYYPGRKFSDYEEEAVVNDFAVAYWLNYGEKEKFSALSKIVRETMGRFIPPAPAGMGYMEYAKQHWNDPDFFTFNDYGWFQFSCVNASLENPKSLPDAILDMGIQPGITCDSTTLCYSLDEDEIALQVVRDAIVILKKWGITLPQFPHILVDDANRHGLSTTGR